MCLFFLYLGDQRKETVQDGVNAITVAIIIWTGGIVLGRIRSICSSKSELEVMAGEPSCGQQVFDEGRGGRRHVCVCVLFSRGYRFGDIGFWGMVGWQGWAVLSNLSVCVCVLRCMMYDVCMR